MRSNKQGDGSGFWRFSENGISCLFARNNAKRDSGRQIRVFGIAGSVGCYGLQSFLFPSYNRQREYVKVVKDTREKDGERETKTYMNDVQTPTQVSQAFTHIHSYLCKLFA